MRKHRDCPVTDEILCFLRVRIGVGGRHLGLTRPLQIAIIGKDKNRELQGKIYEFIDNGTRIQSLHGSCTSG